MKRIVAFISFVCALISVNAQTSLSHSDTSLLQEAKKAIENGNALWSQGWKTRDAAMVASVFSPDGVQLAQNGKIIKGREQIMQRQKQAMQSVDPGVIVSAVTSQVWVDGDIAYETGKYSYQYTEKGKPGKDEGKYVTVWKRQADGSWKLLMDMGVPND